VATVALEGATTLGEEGGIRHQTKEDEVGRARRAHGDMRNAYEILVGKPEGKRLLGRCKCSWEDNIKMNLRETVLKRVSVPTIRFSRRTLLHGVSQLLSVVRRPRRD
jgi:hypothetical protein